jgi:pimeloyl-ACP methyl ester carboxylesterase
MKWLILRGLVREQRHWAGFEKVLEAQLKQMNPEAQVLCMDFPGFGTEAERFSPASVAEIVDDLRSRWLRFAQDKKDWNLLAMSLGGMVGMQWCATYPSDFQKLILVNSSIKGLSPLHKRMKPINYPKVISLLLSSEIAEREEKILRMTSNLTGIQLEERTKLHVSFALPVRKRDALSQIVAAIRFQPPAKIPVPTLVVASRGDRLVDPSCSEEIAKFYGAEISYHPNANHDLTTDDPEWMAKQVMRWSQASVT